MKSLNERLGLVRIPIDFSAGIAPHTALGHPTQPKRDGPSHVACLDLRAAPAASSFGREAFAHKREGSKTLCNVGRLIDHSSTLTGHLNSVVHVIVSSLLPSFICSSFLPYSFYSFFHQVIYHGFFIKLHSSWWGRDQSNHTGKGCFLCRSFGALLLGIIEDDVSHHQLILISMSLAYLVHAFYFKVWSPLRLARIEALTGFKKLKSGQAIAIGFRNLLTFPGSRNLVTSTQYEIFEVNTWRSFTSPDADQSRVHPEFHLQNQN